MMQVTIDLALPGDDAAIRRLVRRQPVPGRVTIAYEREPDFSLGCAVTGEDCRILVARHTGDGEVIGVACRSVRRVFLNGHEQRIGYLGQLRIDDRFRGQWLVSRGFSLLRKLHEEDPVPGYLVAMIGNNPEATGVLVEKRRRGFPAFHPVSDYCTLALDVLRPKPPLEGHAQIFSGSRDQLAEIARFLQKKGPQRQLFPLWTEETLESLTMLGLCLEDLRVARRNGKIVGVMGLWDQSAYKQSVVRGYSGWLKAVAPLWNSSAAWFGRAALPRPGEKLRSAYAAFVCVAKNDASVFAGLLREIYNLAAARGFDYLLVGLDARDPLLPLASAYAHMLYPSRLYLAEWIDGGHLHEQFDQRSAYLDIATL